MSHLTSSRRYLSQTQKPIIHSRESSIDSRTSSSTTDSRYTSSRTSMANGYQGSSQSQVYEDHPSERTHRVFDSSLSPTTKHPLQQSTNYDSSKDGYRITTKSSHNVDVTNHNASRIVPDEPRASQAKYEEYKETQKYRSSKRGT